MYEVLLRGEDPQISFGQQFWNEFFLLKPKVCKREKSDARLNFSFLLSVMENEK